VLLGEFIPSGGKIRGKFNILNEIDFCAQHTKLFKQIKGNSINRLTVAFLKFVIYVMGGHFYCSHWESKKLVALLIISTQHYL
jgi:hypothetical protein